MSPLEAIDQTSKIRGGREAVDWSRTCDEFLANSPLAYAHSRAEFGPYQRDPEPEKPTPDESSVEDVD